MGYLFFRRVIVIILTIVLIQTGVAFAQDRDSKTITLKDAVTMAVSKNVLIREAVENQKAALEEEKAAKKDFLPKASASYSYLRFKDRPYFMFNEGVVAKVDMGPKDNYHWDVTLTQPIFTGFALSTKRKMAKLGVDIKGLEREQAILDVTKQVKVAYYNILLAKKFLTVAYEAVSQLKSHVNDAVKFYKHGIIPYNDTLKSQVALANAIQNGIKVESSVEMAISSFNTLLRIDIDTETAAEDLLVVEPYTFDQGLLFDEAMTNRPELKVLRLALMQADYTIRLTKSSYYPQVALVARYEQNGDNPRAGDNDFQNDHNASIVVQAKWTFFEWGKKGADTKKYYHERLSLAEKVKGIEDSIRLEVKNAFVNLRVADKNIETAKGSLTQAQENYRITNLQYQQQMTTSTEVLDARMLLTQAETNYYSALYGYMLSLAELERAVGKG